MTITELNNNIQNFNVEIAIDKVILNNEPEILALNKEQLMSGIRSDGKALQPYRNPEYADYKLQLNPAGVTDLKLTGDFHAGFKLDNEDYSISSTDEKNEELTAKYGIELFGLTENNMDTLTDEKLTPQLTEAFQKILP